MTKPTGQAWRNWKKGQVRKLLSEGHPIPTNWEEHWCGLHEEPKRLEDSSLKERIRVLSIELEQANRRAITHDAVRHEIIQLARSKPSVPEWLTEHKEHRTSHPGVPTLFLSDWHWGEVVDPKQISGCNKYDLEIAHARARRCVENTIDLLTNHMVNPRYPGIVLAIGGDMFSGDIHEELSRSNEKPVMPLVLDLYGVLVEVINKLVSVFGKVFVPCVTGNHSRTTRKPQSKDRNAMNFDWLLYCLLEKYFENDKRIKFLVGDGPDVSWQVFGKKYCLTHGDQFRGGDSIIGPLGPITRGDLKKRGRNNSIGDRYDVLLLGHWHQLIQMQRLIVNGCFTGNQKVLTNTGLRCISSISEGDTVMSRDGTMQTVTHVFKKSADTINSFKIHGLPRVLEVTPNHLVWAVKGNSKSSTVTPVRRHHIGLEHSNPQWIPAGFLSPGDFVHIPVHVGNDRPVDAETAWAYGLYIAEGHTSLDGGSSKKHNRVCLTMHEREVDVVQRFADWFTKTFPGKGTPRITHRKGRHTTDFSISPGREVCVFFRETFGHTAKFKKLPDGALSWADDLKAALVKGWFDGDGHIHTDPDGSTTTSATTISEELAWGMMRIAHSTGLHPVLSVLKAGGPRKNDAFTLHLNKGQNVVVVDGEKFYKIAERFERNAPGTDVYDLEVSGEHTYCVEGVGVHNSLKGYDEYAYSGNFGFEEPKQALWLTHPEHGITFQVPVLVDEKKSRVERPWVTF